VTITSAAVRATMRNRPREADDEEPAEPERVLEGLRAGGGGLR
jgi:hypothetical protein